jgi:hypothetical protein
MFSPTPLRALGNPYPAGQSSATIHVQDDSICSGSANVPITKLVANKFDGQQLASGDKVVRGTQLTITASLSADCYREVGQDGMYWYFSIIEVRNASDITQSLAWQQGTIQPWTESSFGTSWTAPDQPGVYTIRAFSIPPPESTAMLSQVVSINIVVT